MAQGRKKPVSTVLIYYNANQLLIQGKNDNSETDLISIPNQTREGDMVQSTNDKAASNIDIKDLARNIVNQIFECIINRDNMNFREEMTE